MTRNKEDRGLIGEPSTNDRIGDALRAMHPKWSKEGVIETEKTKMVNEGGGRQPDIVVRHPGGLTVLIESEYHPADEVERDARKRLKETLKSPHALYGEIEQVIALRMDADLRKVDQGRHLEEVKKAEYEFCLISRKTKKNPAGRYPENGWIKGKLEDLATFIEHASLSEKKIKKGMKHLMSGVDASAAKYMNECPKKKREEIAEKLHQPENFQTARMAMAIIVNAFTFQFAIARKKSIKNRSQMKKSMEVSLGNFKGSVVDEWGRICREINFVPIFDIATGIVEPLDEKMASEILEMLSNVASRLATIGTTRQHDFSGRLFQRLISDRKFLATFFTLPSSSALLAELAVSRMPVDWTSREEMTRLRIGDFACGTGALLNAAYGAMMMNYRRGGGRTIRRSTPT